MPKALRGGFFEFVLVLAAMIFIRKEVYLHGEFSTLLLSTYEYAVLAICFLDGYIRGGNPFRLRVLRIILPVAFFFYVACAELSFKLNAAAIHLEWLRDSGLALMVISLVLSIWSRVTVLPAGPWRWLRFPDYFAALLMLMGLTLGLGSWLPLFALPGFFVAGKWEAADLESFRISQMGDSYLEYRKRTWCLFPFIY
ncbi:MAG: hypothetical protein K2W82_06360 [Candidatus Obscuribacterales bacterium]|jgi:protein-S-isoprenylcysteine O-methyltransferase Ste14|nr:hypothetical protein [Candidatus Obscuribacterales bacterium]